MPSAVAEALDAAAVVLEAALLTSMNTSLTGEAIGKLGVALGDLGIAKELVAALDKSTEGNGAVPTPQVPNLQTTSANERVGILHRTAIRFDGFDVELEDAVGVIAHGEALVYTFPEGNILVLGAMLKGQLNRTTTGVNADWRGFVSVGTSPNTIAPLSTLTDIEADLIPSTVTPQADGGETTCNARCTYTELPHIFNGTLTPQKVYINLLVNDADHDVETTECSLRISGYLILHWIDLGDI